MRTINLDEEAFQEAWQAVGRARQDYTVYLQRLNPSSAQAELTVRFIERLDRALAAFEEANQ